MDWITTYASETQLQQTVNALAQCNDRTARFGLSLTAREMEELAWERFAALRAVGRVEFGGGILPALIDAFCDSAYLQQTAYAETICTLQEIFYAQKGACWLSDAELLVAMRRVYDELAGGDAAFLADVPPVALRRIAAGGSLRGTGLERGDG